LSPTSNAPYEDPTVSQLEALLVCDDPPQAHWELKIPSDANLTFTLLGWLVRPEPIDAGVPEPVVSLLSEALAASASVSFFSGKPRTGLLSRLLPRRKEADANVCHATHAESIAQLFDDAHFVWSQRAQAAFLSTQQRASHSLRLQDLEDALAGRGYESFRNRGVAALLVPGVDGDVAGFYALDAEIGRRMRASLYEAVLHRKAEWRHVNKADFARALARSAV
jgi:hypothetical protein